MKINRKTLRPPDGRARGGRFRDRKFVKRPQKKYELTRALRCNRIKQTHWSVHVRVCVSQHVRRATVTYDMTVLFCAAVTLRTRLR